MKLRNYKNLSEFYANKPWCFPSVKMFSPKKQWAQRKYDNNLINAEYKRKFKDNFALKNAGELQHMFDHHGQIQTTMWECALRDLKPDSHYAKEKSKSKSPKKAKKMS